MKQFFGTCVGNPFESVDKLIDIIDGSREITKQTFLKHCEVDREGRAMFAKYPRSYSFAKNRDIYFYTWSMIEHFYS